MNQEEKEDDAYIIKENDYCTCKAHSSIYADTSLSDFGYWDMCSDCNKRIKDGFHYYDHYDGEDHDDIEIYDM